MFDNEVYNVGSGILVTIKELADMVMKLVSKKLPVVYMFSNPGT